MALWGLAKPVVANYTNTSGTIAYSNKTVCDKAVEYSVAVTATEDTILYADNGIAENEVGTFKSGEITLKTSGLPFAISKKILGTHEVTKTWTVGTESKTATVQVFDDATVPPYLGFGIIECHSESGTKKYRAVWFPKVYFKVPDESAKTKGESVEWQTPEIKGTILRSDVNVTNEAHPWKEDAWFSTESAAIEFLEYMAGGSSTSNSNTENEED